MRALPLLAVLVVSCGYGVDPDRGRARVTDGTLPRIAVLPFDNATFRRGYEIELTRRVQDELRARSARAAVAPSRADLLLEGTLVAIDEDVLSEDRQDEVRESSLLVTVEIRLRERLSGELRAAYRMTEREPFSGRAGRVRTVDEARTQVLRDLAERIVYRLESEEIQDER